MYILAYAIFFSLVGGIFSLLGGVLLLKNKHLARGIVVHLLGFAAGALLGAAFLDILPEAFAYSGDASASAFWTLVGICSFFLFETFFLWFHHHDADPETTEQQTTFSTPLQHSHAPLLLTIGDSIHNFIDGMAIGAAFLISVPLGIVTSIAVAAHEIPSEIGDFMIMLHSGWSERKIILANILSALLSTVGAIITIILGSLFEPLVGTILAITAGFFIYIATADLVPEIYRTTGRDKISHVAGFFLLGLAVIGALVFFLE